MLVLFETPAGYALFKVTDEAKLASPDELHKHFESADSAARIVKLKAFSKFADTVEVRNDFFISETQFHGLTCKHIKCKFQKRCQIIQTETTMQIFVTSSILR